MNSERPLSVIHLLAPASFGGLETVVASLAPALVSTGQRVAVALVLTPESNGTHPLQAALAGTGVDVEPIVVKVRDYLGERRRVGEMLERRSADILHTHGYRPDVVDAPIARRRGVPTVTTVHGYIGGGSKNRVYEWLQTRSFRRCDAVIAVSDRLATQLVASGIEQRRIHRVQNAWKPRIVPSSREEARRDLGLPAHGSIVGWVGRMSTEKAPDIMVRAAAGVRAPGVRFSMIGDGPLRGECEMSAAALAVDDRVSWHGVVPSAGTLLRAFDVVVQTSWSEGTPMLLFEAMAAGVPVVATEVGGVGAVLSSTEAHLCPAGDVERIATAIDDVLADPGGASKRAVAAKSRLEVEFAVEPWAARHVEIYRGLAGV